MDILVVGSEASDRVEKFQHFVRAEGHQPRRIVPGARLPAGPMQWLGAVLFDRGAANLADVVGALREQLRYLSMPLIVVASQGSDPGMPDQGILKDLQAGCQAQPVTPELRVQLAEPLCTAVQQTLREMVGVEVALRSVYQRETPATLGDLTVLLRTSTYLEGAMVMNFSTRTAAALAARVLAEVPPAEHAALVHDCMGEIANVVAGQAKALLAGTPYQFIFSTPDLVAAGHCALMSEHMESMVIAFDSDMGGFALQLCRHRDNFPEGERG